MPILPDARHEKFAQRLAMGDTADKAYQRAGFKAHRGNAARLSANENLKARLAEILAATAKQVQDELVWDAKTILADVKAIEDRALAAADFKTALEAAKFIVECFGYKDSPTLTHEHVHGKRIPETAAPTPGTPDPMNVLRSGRAFRMLKATLHDG